MIGEAAVVAVIAERGMMTNRARRSVWTGLRVPLVAVLALVFMVFFVERVYDDRALPGLKIAGVAVGSLGEIEIRDLLQAEVVRPSAEAVVVASLEGRTWQATNAELAIAPDIDAATRSALAFGKQGGVANRARAWFAAARGTLDLGLITATIGTAAKSWVARIANDVQRTARDGALVMTSQGITVTDPVIGRDLDVRGAMAQLLASRTVGPRELALAVRTAYPAVDDAGLADAVAKARAATTALQVIAGERSAAEDGAGLATLLVVDKIVAASGELPLLPEGATAPAHRYRYTVSLNEVRVREWIAALAVLLDRPAKSASYQVGPGGALTVIPSVNGMRIDQEKLFADVRTSLFAPTTGVRQLAATMTTDTPTFTTAQAARYATALVRVSSFTTSYPPNAARHANITTGASQFDGLVIGPGEAFSFWDRLGPVTVQRGYAYAGAIIDGRSDENVIGGGLCQVSTTLFNAVARAGYEILERSGHSQYIDRYPMGFDAAVFLPGADFRWRNDTSYPVLIRAHPAGTSVSFELFSVSSGRTVVIGDPVETNLTRPANDQPADAAYPPGAVVLGRDVTRSWTVYENGQVVQSETFRSHYLPVWGGPAR